jgi:DNA-binding CsgD family transcriptional regulator
MHETRVYRNPAGAKDYPLEHRAQLERAGKSTRTPARVQERRESLKQPQALLERLLLKTVRTGNGLCDRQPHDFCSRFIGDQHGEPDPIAILSNLAGDDCRMNACLLDTSEKLAPIIVKGGAIAPDVKEVAHDLTSGIAQSIGKARCGCNWYEYEESGKNLLTDINASNMLACMKSAMIGTTPLRSSRREAPTSGSLTAHADPPVSDPSLRKIGIDSLGERPWGTHICVFYETKHDLLDTAASYFEAGLQNNEFCVWAISDPITEQEAEDALHRAIPDFDRHLAAGRIELLPGTEWYLKGDQFDLKRITNGWSEKLSAALARGYKGMRVSGNAFWIETKHWKEFCEYEQELDRSLAGQQMIVLCTYPLHASRAVDMLDVARAHQFSIARRNGAWEFLETPELKQAKQEIGRLNAALDTLSDSFPARVTLTPRERVVLAQIVRGFSSKEIARTLGISQRTVEFHRANILAKIGAKNTVDLVRKILGE